MKNCIYIKNILGKIIKYSDFKEIILLSQCDKTLSKEIDPDNNTLVNNLFLENVNQLYFYSKDYNLEKKQNLLDDYLKSDKNWKLFLKELILNFKNYDDKNISKIVKESFQLHLYLQDLRKENFNLEYEFSSNHQYMCYDLLERIAIYNNRYKKQITEEYLEESLKKPEKETKLDIKLLKSGEFYAKLYNSQFE